jgi:hypothetical protein
LRVFVLRGDESTLPFGKRSAELEPLHGVQPPDQDIAG